MKIIMNFDDCTLELAFQIDKDMVLDTIETENVHDFRLLVNGEVMNLDNDIKFIKGDEIMVRITREDEFSDSLFTLVGYDPETVFDRDYIPETPADEPYTEEDIYINTKEDENNG